MHAEISVLQYHVTEWYA